MKDRKWRTQTKKLVNVRYAVSKWPMLTPATTIRVLLSHKLARDTRERANLKGRDRRVRIACTPNVPRTTTKWWWTIWHPKTSGVRTACLKITSSPFHRSSGNLLTFCSAKMSKCWKSIRWSSTGTKYWRTSVFFTALRMTVLELWTLRCTKFYRCDSSVTTAHRMCVQTAKISGMRAKSVPSPTMTSFIGAQSATWRNKRLIGARNAVLSLRKTVGVPTWPARCVDTTGAGTAAWLTDRSGTNSSSPAAKFSNSSQSYRTSVNARSLLSPSLLSCSISCSLRFTSWLAHFWPLSGPMKSWRISSETTGCEGSGNVSRKLPDYLCTLLFTS